MNMKLRLVFCTVVLTALQLMCINSKAQLPTNFPPIEVTTYDSNKVSPGYLFVGTWSSAPDSGSYLMILNNDGTPVDDDKYVELQKTAIDFKVQPNGLLSYAQSLAPLAIGGGWDVEHEIVDDSVTNIVETIQMRNGYLAESHDFQLLPNGDVLQFGYYFSEVDLSQIVSGGNPAALVSGGVIQELDSQRNAVFQWRAWDHYNFADFSYPNPTAATVSEFHINDIILDVDGNILAGTPTEIRKINRQTGEVMWTLGGSANEFTITNVVPGGFTATASDFGGHGTYRLPNGNFMEYDNSHGGITSRAIEYSLDESNKIATVVWSYTPTNPILGFATGYAQRLPNGNTLICWGLPRNASVPICTEVTPAGEKAFELTITNTSLLCYRAFRFPYPAADQKIQFTHPELAAGNPYNFTNTGVEIDVTSGAGGYNSVTVTREPYAPLDPSFVTIKPPRVLPVRVNVEQTDISSMTADIFFDANSLGFDHPEQLTVYQRTTPGAGPFVALPMIPYNPTTKQVGATMTQFGEFIFGYPDVAEMAYPPILARPENYRGVQTNNVVAAQKAESNVVYTVNEELPILLSWSPRGFGRYFNLEVATDSSFTTLVTNKQYRTDAFFVLSNALPNTTYFWRVQTITADNSTSDWSTNSFQTVAPMIQVIAPNGGESWQSGIRYFVHWSDNFAEPVVIDLYKGGTFLRSLNTNSSWGAYRWRVDSDLAAGNDYSIRITSATNAALFAESTAPFSINAPTFDDNSVAVLPDGKFKFSLTAPGATQATVLGSTNLTNWVEIQTVSLTNNSAVFDAGSANSAYQFYRLRVP